MSELPIVKALHDLSTDLAGVNDSVGDKFTLPNVTATLIRELVEALEAARSQVKTLGVPEDAVNNHIIAVCDFAIAKAKQPIGGRDGN